MRLKFDRFIQYCFVNEPISMWNYSNTLIINNCSDAFGHGIKDISVIVPAYKFFKNADLITSYYYILDMNLFSNYSIYNELDKDALINYMTDIIKDCKIVGVSALFHMEVVISLIIASHFPDITFVIGGPAIRTRVVDYIIPNNVILLDNEIKYDTYWSFSDDDILNLTDDCFDAYNIIFPLKNKCYWGKCVFCYGYKQQTSYYFNLEACKVVNSNINKIIWLRSEALSPFELSRLYSLPMGNNLYYYSFLRADNIINSVLEESLAKISDTTKFGFFIGIEYPSNRMLQLMKKGTTVDIMRSVISLLLKYNCSIRLSVILGWDSFTRKDYLEGKEFFEWLADNIVFHNRPRIAISLRRKYNTKIVCVDKFSNYRQDFVKNLLYQVDDNITDYELEFAEYLRGLEAINVKSVHF